MIEPSSFPILSSHWLNRASRELILVKNSLARERLKIEQYIRTAAAPDSAPVLARGANGRVCWRRCAGRRTKRERKNSLASQPQHPPSCSFLHKCCTRSIVLSYEELCHCLVESAVTSFLPSCLTPVPFLDVSSDQQSFFSLSKC